MPKERGDSENERRERAEEYMAAARDHQAALATLPLTPRHFPFAYYVAGLALECLFRAYEELVGVPHDAGHDLFRHAEAGRFFSFMPESRRDILRDDLNEVWKRWLNNHRYRSLSSLRRFLNEAELYRISRSQTVKGDVVAYNWDVLLESTLNLLAWGIEQWTNSKKKWSR